VAGVVYQRTDRYEEFPGTDRAQMESYDRQLKEAADVTLYCSKLLHEQESPHCSSAAYIDHGVDFEDFEAAGKNPQDPEDVHPIVRPRVGFVGGIDEHTFDRRLFLQVAERLADVQFVLVGACSLGEDWCTLPNVTLLGRKPYPEVPAYMAACDVLIMPWNDNDWIRACNPVKLKEYLAVGRPIVSTDFPELRRYEGYIRVARSAEEFAIQIQNALAAPDDPERLRARVRGESWSARADAVISRLADAGLEVREQRGSPESNERRY
jgi:glycosyltransferase involved in cell wall biosynthesis